MDAPPHHLAPIRVGDRPPFRPWTDPQPCFTFLFSSTPFSFLSQPLNFALRFTPFPLSRPPLARPSADIPRDEQPWPWPSERCDPASPERGRDPSTTTTTTTTLAATPSSIQTAQLVRL